MAWMGLGSIIAIIGIVIVAGSIIAVLGKLLLNAFDGEHKVKTDRNADVLDYQQYKEIEAGKTQTNEYDFEQINLAKANKEKELLEKDETEVFTIREEDDDLQAIENRLKADKEEKEEINELPEMDEIDVMNLVDEISDDVIEDEKVVVDAQPQAEMDPALSNLTIDDYLNQEEEEVQEKVAEEAVEEDEKIKEESVEDEIADEILEELIEEVEEESEVQEEPEIDSSKVELDKANEQIELLKAQLMQLNSQLEEAKNNRPAVAVDMTEEECLARLATLEDRLKTVKKDFKINQKEYKPLKKIMKDYERYQTKLRRKDAVVAKKKVDLYGVNNYVDIDKEKAEKLANELELLDGLRLSVSHCEEVINANKERFPILEHTNKILTEQIAHLESDIEAANITLQRIREKNGNGNPNNGESQE